MASVGENLDAPKPKNGHWPKAASKKSRFVVFKSQDPLFNVYYSNDSNMRAVCQISITCIVTAFMAIIVNDSINAGHLTWSFLMYVDTVSFSSFVGFILVELSLHLVVLAVYPIFKLWIASRSSFTNSTCIVDTCFIMLFIITSLASFPYIIWACPYFELPRYLRATVTIEQIKVILKAYSFIRENAYKVLYPWHKDDDSGPAVWYDGQMSPSIGSFRQYFYYLFCPTLLYRDHYPRLPGPIRWRNVLLHFGYFVAGLIIAMQVYTKFQAVLHWTGLVKSFFGSQVFGILILTSLCMSLMHGYMTMAAEVMRFADRRFYEDWWNSTGYAEWYRKWNIIPHQFIHQYLYTDVKNVTRSKRLAMFIPILVSALMHEYIIAVSCGFFIPVLTVMFAGLGVFVALTLKGQFYLLFSMNLGVNVMLWSYAFEIISRRVCAREETFVDLIYPRLWECIVKYNY